MTVVSDTTPLRYLIEVGEVDILENIFGSVLIPEKVAEELQRPKTPEKVKDWMRSIPAWLEVCHADCSLFVPRKKIGGGEREAFALALELRADAVLIDDKDATLEAVRHNIVTIPTFSLLEEAGARDLIDLHKVVAAFRKTTFRLPPEEVIDGIFERHRRRVQS